MEAVGRVEERKLWVALLKIHCINAYTFQRRNKILCKKLRVEIVCQIITYI